jgi:hypothetical protein
MNPGEKKCFAGVDVADTGDYLTVHQKRLYRNPPALRESVQPLGVEAILERLRAQIPQKRVFEGVIPGPKGGAEASWIAETQAAAVAHNHVQVIVLLRRQFPGHNAQASGHAEMQNQVTDR